MVPSVSILCPCFPCLATRIRRIWWSRNEGSSGGRMAENGYVFLPWSRLRFLKLSMQGGFCPQKLWLKESLVGGWRTLEVSYCQAGTLWLPVPPQGLTDSSSVLVATLLASLGLKSASTIKEPGENASNAVSKDVYLGLLGAKKLFINSLFLCYTEICQE